MPNDALDFQQIVRKASDLEQVYRDRNEMYDKIEAMYLMDWIGPTVEDDELKLTISPSARNAALGAIRMLTAADPHFTVNWEINDDDSREKSEIVEKFAAALWFASGRIRQRPIHYDAVQSAVLFGEVHIGMSLTDDLVQAAKEGSVSPSASVRLERTLRGTPLLFDVYDPRTGYPEYDSYGLSSYARKVKVKAGEIFDRWGEERAITAGLSLDQRTDEVEYWDYWDYTHHVVWVSGSQEPLFNGAHGLGSIPVVAYITDGSYIHTTETQRRQPFLYTLLKSGLWERENLALTFIHDNIAKMGLTPTYKHKKADENDQIFIDTSVQGGVISSRGDFSPVQKNLIDPSVKEALEMDGELITESTIFKQALGQPVGANTPFSAVSLLNQTGRLPLIAIQRLCSESFGKAMETAFFLLREKGGTAKAAGKDGLLSLKAKKELPESVVVQAVLEISTPQDARSDAMVAMQVVQAGLATKRFARETYLGIGQSRDMEQQLLDEKMDELMLQMEMEKERQKVMGQLQPPPNGATMDKQAGVASQPPMNPPTGDAPPQELAGLMGAAPAPAESMVSRNGLPAMPLNEPQMPTNIPGMGALGG